MFHHGELRSCALPEEENLFQKLTQKIEGQVAVWSERLLALPAELISERRNKQNRTVQQILGHLVDSAVNNHHRIVRLQLTEELVFPDYRQDNDRWIAVQNYQGEDWEQLVKFWRLYNQHMVHIIKHVDVQCLDHAWHDFEGNRETLRTIIEGYLWHLNLHLGEIDALITE